MDKIIRKAPRNKSVQTTIAPQTKLCFEGTGVNRKIVLYKNGVKDCLPLPEGGGGDFGCSDLVSCPIIVQIQSDVTDIESDISTIGTAITNLQNSTTVEAMQDAVAPLLVHGNHVGLTATYNDTLNEIILTVTGGGGSFSCLDVSTCISSNTTTQTALLEWLEGLTNVTLTGDWVFNGETTHNGDVNFNSNTVTFDNTVINNDNGTTINNNGATVNNTNTTIVNDEDTTIEGGTYNNSTINNSTITNVTINGTLTGAGVVGADEKLQATRTVINQVIPLITIPRSGIKSLQISVIGGIIQISPTDYSYNAGTNEITMLIAPPINPTEIEIQYAIKDGIVTGTAFKIGPVTRTPAGSSLVIPNASSTATSIITGDNIIIGTPNGNYFVYDMSTPGQITVTSKDFLGTSVSESGLQFYYSIVY